MMGRKLTILVIIFHIISEKEPTTMLQIQKISKTYKTGDLIQAALDEVSLNLRDNEFVAILGPSGSGKTTLLNVIGGLDRYDSGDLIINGISTRKYKSKDWDSYRNHTIGFVFQSYNLIPHQSILANVELALTISGIKRSERKRRAKQALEQVGLGDQLHKRPNQMSGGQIQRVAIARALVNDPDILLADEPTGALDTETSIQVMNLLKEVAKDRLVVMVTHNPELAEEYANRIVKLRDGKIISDTNPYEVDEAKLAPATYKNMGKSSMSFGTSLSLSFNNLRTKKGRTLLTAFAGSIGIIGIALILSISSGVNTYIENIQKDTMTSYPITIDAQAMDLSSLIGKSNSVADKEANHELDAVYSNPIAFEMVSSMTTSFKENNLTAFKKYLDDANSPIHQYIGENGIVYSYDTKFNVYTKDPNGDLVSTDGSTLSDPKSGASSMLTPDMSSMGAMASMTNVSTNSFQELIPGKNGDLISNSITDKYDLLYGSWPKEYTEVVLMLDKNNEISQEALYKLGILPSSEYKEIVKKLDAGEPVTIDPKSWSYEEIGKQEFYLIPACDAYVENVNGTFSPITGDKAAIQSQLKKAIKLKISGVVRSNDADTVITAPIGYTQALTNYLIDYTNKSTIVKAQMADKTINVLNGVRFAPSDDATKIEDTKNFLSSLGVSEKAKLCKDIMQKMYGTDSTELSQIMAMGETELAAMLDAYLMQPSNDVLLSIYKNYISVGSFEDNMTNLGVVSLDAPSSINLYADSFEAKDGIAECITNYNSSTTEANHITYTDYVALLMSSITTIINVISYVLIAFVAVSLVVSSIMIGIITYISVLERTKEIGILRAVGASKRNISQVFNAETFIIGLCSGLIGIGITLLLLIPGNAIIHSIAGTTDVNAILPVGGAIILIVLSMLLTLIGGLIPSKKAAKKDPVTALRSE